MFANSIHSNEMLKSELQKFKNILYSDKSDDELYLNGNITNKNLVSISELETSELRLKVTELKLENMELQVRIFKSIIYNIYFI